MGRNTEFGPVIGDVRHSTALCLACSCAVGGTLAMKEELQSAGLISENEQKTNETLSLRVGKHIFEGKVLKIKKVKQ